MSTKATNVRGIGCQELSVRHLQRTFGAGWRECQSRGHVAFFMTALLFDILLPDHLISPSDHVEYYQIMLNATAFRIQELWSLLPVQFI